MNDSSESSPLVEKIRPIVREHTVLVLLELTNAVISPEQLDTSLMGTDLG